MASLLTNPMFEISGGGPPPNKNYYNFAVTQSHVIWRWWRISVRAVDRFSKPGELKESHQDFLDDGGLQGEVRMIFGRQILEYTKALCRGQYDYLEHLSDSLLLRIINYLELEDVGQLGRTSHRFRQLCGSKEFWEQAVRHRCNTVSAEVASLALEIGWRSILFTSKLQLQKLISRRRAKTEERVTERPDESSDWQQPTSSAEESHSGIIPNPNLGPITGSSFVASSCCDGDPCPHPEPEAGSGSSAPVSGQLLEDKCVAKAAVQKRVLNKD